MGCNERYKVLMIKSFDLSGDDKRKTVIMANIYKILSSEDDFLSKWKDSPEWSPIIKTWAPLFEDTGVELVWGDTKNETFKVDLRLCEHMFDISNIEFKKSGDNPGAVKRDRVKVLGEAKAMLNRKIRDCRLDFSQAKSKKVIVGQVCGLKAVFSSLHLAAPGYYIPYQYGRTIKYPNDANRAIRSAGPWLEQLFCYKDEVVEEAQSIKGVLAKDRSEFGSNTTIENNCFLKQTYKIQDTAKKWPEINDDFYKW
ncbi:hypothetical protein BD560DRAFT_372219 [Blakeslea trispora]|nr:hypothetical protein BD560DRAFT_372219 [Blakeslea trispora]